MMKNIINTVKDALGINSRGAAVLTVVCGLVFLGLTAFVIRIYATTDYHNISYSNCHVSAKPAPYYGGFKSSVKIYPITTSCGSFTIVHADLYDSISVNETYEIVTGPKTTLEQPDVISAVPSKK